MLHFQHLQILKKQKRASFLGETQLDKKFTQVIYELQCEETYLLTYGHNDHSNQTAHLLSLIYDSSLSI